MKLLVYGDFGSGALVGAGAVLLAPIVVPAVASGLKYLMKTTVRGGAIAYREAKNAASGMIEGLENLAAEAKAEIEEESANTR